MNRISLFAVSVAVVLASFPVRGAGGDDDPKHHENFAKCAKTCADCQLQCDACFHHCAKLLADGKKEHAKSMQLCVDCAELCSTAAKLVARHSPLSALACEACANGADLCAASCEKFDSDMHMAACAKACRQCARECREMVKHLVHRVNQRTSGSDSPPTIVRDRLTSQRRD
ncbi:MAG: four-helix bundle copper-binding protein [Planctomycetes bacterium]|nr:four-helix bundle copper-binding protein [Planctomycetota bacterium]